MKININYMPIFCRTPNCTFVNVGQSKSKFYRMPTKEVTLLPRILLLWLKTPRCRGVITGKIRPPIQGSVLRGRVDAHEEPVNRPVDRRIWRGVDEHAALQQIKPHAQPPPKQMKSSGVQSVINGEHRNVNNVYNTDPMLITCDNTTDIFISKPTKDKIWNFWIYWFVITCTTRFHLPKCKT